MRSRWNKHINFKQIFVDSNKIKEPAAQAMRPVISGNLKKEDSEKK